MKGLERYAQACASMGRIDELHNFRGQEQLLFDEFDLKAHEVMKEAQDKENEITGLHGLY